jgi:Fe-Mn family superoxide dismutase
MEYQSKDFSSLLGMKGFSDEMLEDHFSLYEGYVSNVNELLAKLNTLDDRGELDSSEHAELRRRLGWEFDGMRLHELYFGNLGGDGKAPSGGELAKRFTSSFSSVEKWTKEFKAVGAMRGVGWAVLAFDPAGERLLNLWIDEHDVGHAAGCSPLLVMDVWEHAFMTDYRTDRASYIDAFLRNVDWREVERRLFAARNAEVASR